MVQSLVIERHLRSRRAALLSALVFGAAVAGCSRASEPESHPVERTPATPTASAAPDPPAQPAIFWTDPSGWPRLTGGSSVGAASYVIPKAPGDPEDASLVISHSERGEGASIQDSVEHWLREFSGTSKAAKREERTVSDLKQLRVETAGTYSPSAALDGGQPHKQKDFALLGAAVETRLGNYYFKLIGPQKTVSAAREEFTRTLDTVRIIE